MENIGIKKLYKALFPSLDKEILSSKETASVEDAEKILAAVRMTLKRERQRDAIILRFGLEDGIWKTRKKVGEIMGCSPCRIEQLEKIALRLLRWRSYRLPALFGFVPPELKPYIPTVKVITADSDVGELDVSDRTFNALKRYAPGIQTIKDVLEYPKEDWPKIRNIGRKAISEIQEGVRKLGWQEFTI